MLLCALDMMVPTHQTIGIWRHPDADVEQYRDLDFWIRHARLLEAAQHGRLVSVGETRRDPALVDAVDLLARGDLRPRD